MKQSLKKRKNEKIRNKIVKRKLIILSSVSIFFERWAEKYRYLPSGQPLSYVQPTKTEREQSSKRIGLGLAISLVIIVVTVIVCLFSKYYFTVYNEELSFGEWNSSAGSFWGAVLGAMIAGIAAVVTTVFVIQRSYKIDYHRERLEVLPVLDVTLIFTRNLVRGNTAEEILKGITSNEKVRDILFDASVEQQYPSHVFLIKNVGRGIAYKVHPSGFCRAHYNEAMYSGLLPQNESIILVTRDKSINAAKILYYDLYSNMYQQSYSFTSESVITEPPELLRKTERIRYTQ